MGFGSETWNVWKNFLLLNFLKKLFLIERGGVLSKGLRFQQITPTGLKREHGGKAGGKERQQRWWLSLSSTAGDGKVSSLYFSEMTEVNPPPPQYSAPLLKFSCVSFLKKYLFIWLPVSSLCHVNSWLQHTAFSYLARD